jgi:DNA-binding GntR family transcriptional regulator
MNAIITCGLAPGEKVAQPQLAERYQIGLTPIREALQRLAQEGLVRSLPRFGYIVTPITLSDVKEVFELRSILDLAGIRLAIERGSDEELDRVVENAGRNYASRDQLSEAELLVRGAEFHTAVAVASGNRRLTGIVSKLVNELTRFFRIGLSRGGSLDEFLKEQLDLAEALRDRDRERCEQVIQRHYANALDLVREALAGEAPTNPGAPVAMSHLINLP